VKVVHIVSAISRDHRDPAEILAQRWPLTEQLDALSRSDVECVVLQVAGWDDVLRRDGVTYRFVRPRWPVRPIIRLPLMLRWIPSFGLLARSLRPDVLHVHGLAHPLEMIALKRALPTVPLLAQDRASRPARGVRSVVQRWGLAKAEGIVFADREQAAAFVAAGVLDATKPIFEVAAGSCTFMPGDQRSARAATGLHGNPCLLWVGHLSETKDPLTVLGAFARVVARLPDPQLWCCFETAPLRSEVERRIEADPRLQGRVHLLGFRPRAELEQYYRAADFFILGSHHEGCSYAAIESVACGTPVVATQIPGFKPMTARGVGARFPVGNAAAAAEALVECAHRDRVSQRKAARALFEDTLSYDVIARRLREAYGALIASSASAGA
jgi:glycosyltransferase involved in cell wall biosynthesis